MKNLITGDISTASNLSNQPEFAAHLADYVRNLGSRLTLEQLIIWSLRSTLLRQVMLMEWGLR